MNQRTKRCPYCAEMILEAAIVCRYCGRDLPQPSSVQSARPPLTQGPRGTLRPALFVFFTFAVMFLCVMACGFLSWLATPTAPRRTTTAVAQVSDATEAVAAENTTRSPEPTATRTYTPSATPTSMGAVTVLSGANLRAGPGLGYAVVGSARAGDVLPLYGRTEDGWLQVSPDGSQWIALSLVGTGDMSVTTVPISALIPPTPTVTATPNLAETKEAVAAASTATAVSRHQLGLTATIEAYVDSPPVGTWCKSNSVRRVCVSDFRYESRVGYSRAPNGGRYVAFGVFVSNEGESDISVSPYDVTFVLQGGTTYDYDLETYSYWASPLSSVTISPGDNTQGGLVFLVSSERPPRRIIYRGGLFEEDIEIDLHDPPMRTGAD